jgi:outer membrane receptor protein involved in Fe transport
VLAVHRSGLYGAGYLQDTWKLTRRFTANYGVRVDWYRQTQNLGQAGINTADISPRVNLAYLVAKRTILRASYNRLFIQPPLAQGAIIGQAIQPETLNQYDVSIERQLTPNQRAKIAYYAKNIRNQIDTGLLVPNTQIGAYTSVNFTEGNVHGVEVSWDLIPRNNVGVGSYVSYTNSLAKPGGLIDGIPGTSAPTYNDHDQLNTISTGVSYTWRSGANAGLDLYYGSGVGSSVLAASNPNNVGIRTPHARVNLLLSSGPRLFGGTAADGRGGVSLIIENLFNDTSVINFNSGFSGTRFDQGRRIVLSVNGHF